MKTTENFCRTRQGAGAFPAAAGAALALLLLPACAFIEPAAGSAGGRTLEEPIHPSYSRASPVVADAAGEESFSRMVNATTGFVGSFLKTYSTDPLVRPFTTARSLGFLAMHTVSDSVKRTYMNTMQRPWIERQPVPPLSAGPGMDLEEWERDLDRITGTRSSTGRLEFLIDGDEFFPELINEMRAAEESIQMRMYIFDNDDYAVRVADLLKQRSEQIDVTVMMDGLGTLTAGQVFSASMPDTFSPPGSITSYLKEGSGVRARLLTNPWFTGDHCKTVIVDRKVAFLGGMNIGREYRYDWHDLMVRVEGPVVEELAHEDEKAWARSGPLGDWAALLAALKPPPEQNADEGYPVRVLHTRPHDSQIYRAKIAAIRRASRYIYIENPYFSDDAILFELIRARRRGVDVRFIISERGDMPMMDMSNVQAVNEMLANGIRVYVYPGMTHAKAAIIDDWLVMGSANLDALSLRVNLELNVATSDPEAVRDLKQRLFERDFENSVELEQPLPVGLTHRFAEAVADVFM